MTTVADEIQIDERCAVLLLEMNTGDPGGGLQISEADDHGDGNAIDRGQLELDSFDLLTGRLHDRSRGRNGAEQHKLDLWLRIEILACEAWSELGKVPKDALPAIRRATFTVERVQEIERETGHDTAAFVDAISESIGPDARWVHFGMTSSDVANRCGSPYGLDGVAEPDRHFDEPRKHSHREA